MDGFFSILISFLHESGVAASIKSVPSSVALAASGSQHPPRAPLFPAAQ